MRSLLAASALALCALAVGACDRPVACKAVPAEHIEEHLDVPFGSLDYEREVWRFGGQVIGVSANGEEDGDVILTSTCK